LQQDEFLETNGQGDLTRGHVSIRVPEDPNHFYMKPHSFGFDEITPENMVVCDLTGEKLLAVEDATVRFSFTLRSTKSDPMS
jgi:ribulose-5-phosphate 4-epimerase/fuculose-1-phosphate aldolase